MIPRRKDIWLGLGLATAISLVNHGCAQAAHRHHRAHRHHYHHHHHHHHHHHAAHPALDANGNAAQVCSRSGICKRVAASARPALQCVVDYVEGHGVRITAMRGYGPGTVSGSLHPSGKALDINQTDRDVTHPAVPRAVSNAAADHCGVVSGARWSYGDNGHWNMKTSARRERQPWPRVLARHDAETSP